MIVQYLVIFLCLLGGAFYKTDSPKNVGKYITYAMVVFVLQSALRDFEVGSDTQNYVRQYGEAMEMSWQEIYQNFIDVYKFGVGKDAGYPAFQKLISYVVPTARLYLFVVAIVFFTALGRVMKEFLTTRKEVFISLCYYQALFYSFYSVTGIRQVLATSFAFWAVIALKKQRPWYVFVALLVAGAIMHKSVLVCLPIYFLFERVNKPKLALLTSYAAFPLMFVFGRVIASYMVAVSAQEVYEMYSNSEFEAKGAAVFAIGLIGVNIFTFFQLKNLSGEKYMPFLVNMLAIATVFTPMAWIDPSLMRVTQYFSLFTLLLVPFIYRNLDKNSTSFYVLFVMLCLLIVLRHNYEYSFGW